MKKLVKRQLAKRCFHAVAFLSTVLWIATCHSEDDYYSADDFSHIKKIDAHVHLNSEYPALVERAIKDNFELLTVNVDYSDFPSLDVQYKTALALQSEYPETVHFASTFSVAAWMDSGYTPDVIAGSISHVSPPGNAELRRSNGSKGSTPAEESRFAICWCSSCQPGMECE